MEEKRAEAGAGLLEGECEDCEEGSQVEQRLFPTWMRWGYLIQVQA